MCRAVAESIRGHLIYLFAGSNFDPLADSIVMRSFGPLPAIESLDNTLTSVEGESVVELSVPNLDGREVSVLDQTSLYTLVLVWSVWCGHCQHEVPKIYEWWRGVDKSILGVICISIDKRSAQLEDYIQSRGWHWKNAIQREGRGEKIEDVLGVYGTPSFFVYSAKGRLISRPSFLDELKATYKALMRGDRRMAR